MLKDILNINKDTMQHNQPLISYYPSDDSKFVDPMYVPYQRKNMPIQGEGCYHPVNTWKKHGCPEMVHPDHIRRGWNMDFLRIHPNDPCPAGMVDIGNGYCSRTYQQAHESNFATSEHFAAKYQYHNGYTISPQDYESRKRLTVYDIPNSEPFLNRSANPHTGQYVVYHDPLPNQASQKYGIMPTRHSYLGK